jgi:hypothetical protein
VAKSGEPPELTIFRLGRTSMKVELDETSRDWRYYQDKGWFSSEYYYPTRLSPAKRAVGSLVDFVGARMSKARA